ncbi:MAG TPA: SDR family NAD(P)-dependent oxidoreductase [Amycolatopsis sp.]|nr:SDR family NAD(P)-dependent oxidoreductase [Amycolatopsis sp.]
MDLKNRVAVVTGGQSGLGAASVEMLLDAGAHVALIDRDASGEHPARHRGPGELLEIEADVSSEQSLDRAFKLIKANFDTVHICVNCAGVATSGKVIKDGQALPLSEFTRAISINLIGLFDVLRRSAELMINNAPGDASERGVIVNVASIAADQGQRGQVAYAASKAGIVGLMLPAARDLAEYGIRVMTIAPGPFHTGMYDGLPRKVTQRIENLALFPHRTGRPREFAELVRHIVSNGYLNATTVQLDAGTRLI